MTVKERIVGSTETKGLLERSGVRALLGTLLSVVVLAWAKGDPVVQSIKDNVQTLLPLALLALGLSSSVSKKTPK